MATADTGAPPNSIARLGDRVYNAVVVLGDWMVFAFLTTRWLIRRRPPRGTLLTTAYNIGARSVGVIMITGTFIGMVLAVQTYGEFHSLGLQSRMGSVINVSVVRELGPVLAATMLAGRVGSAIAAEMATMRITEQIDALSCLGANPIHYLVVPRLITSVVVIPVLTLLADVMGVLGGAIISLELYQIDSHLYWEYASRYVTMWDVNVGLIKSVFFGAAIAIISCHRGFNSKAGSEGVGRAATEAFVASFITILALDFILSLALGNLKGFLWPEGGQRLF